VPTRVPVRVDAQEALAAFHAQVASLAADVARRAPHELLQLVIRHCNLAEHYDDGSPAGRTRVDNLVELRELARSYERFKPAAGLERFLTDIALTSGADDADSSGERVTLITLHMAKGLEYPVVFLTGLEEGMLPHERAFQEPGGLDEERRLCYVGITRAQRRLYITVAGTRTIFARTVALASSQFLHDIPPELLDLVELDGHRSHGIASRVRRGSIGATA
jgi:DNA helicase-2/ATP-dependent DNA helicase PcrA